jgi:phage-related protein
MIKTKKWIKKLFKRIYKFWCKNKANLIDLGKFITYINSFTDFFIRNKDPILSFVYKIIDLIP